MYLDCSWCGWATVWSKLCEVMMTIPEDGYLLRIFVGESDRHGHLPLYESIVLKAREQGLAGATVLRGVMGFGKHSVLHTAKILRLSEDLPMVIRSEEHTSELQSLAYLLCRSFSFK